MNTSIYRSEDAEKRLMEIYDKSLLGWPVPYEGLVIDTRFGKTFVIASGDPANEAMILIHGSGSNALTWRGDAAKYAEHYRVYALDVIGEAGKSSHTRLGWDSGAHDQWLGDVIRGLGIRTCILEGISYGGWIALNYAASNPMQVSKLVLVSIADTSTIKPSYFWKLIFFSFLGDYGKEKLKNMFFAGVPLPPEAIEFFDICSKSFVYRPGFPPNVPDETLAKLSMPVLYLASAKDQIFNAKPFAARLAKNAQCADIRIKNDMGHVLVNTVSDVLGFLERKEL